MPPRAGSRSQTDQELDIDDNLGDDLTVIPYKYSITSYGADYPIDGLVRRINDGSIFIPGFQRSYVWDLKQASRFLESLLLGLPVPGIFLSRDEDSQKLLVIDGQQRLRSLQYFYKGIFEPTSHAFELVDVQPQFQKLTYDTLPPEDRIRLDDSILHATIVKQDDPSDDDSSISQIFERLNTGGKLLDPQEIRVSLYHGEFSSLLKVMNDQNEDWRKVYGQQPSPRLRDQELILRFFALYFNLAGYMPPMKQSLHNYMRRNRHLGQQSEAVLRGTFEPTIELLYACMGTRAFKLKRALNAAVFDAVMIGVAKRLSEGPVQNRQALREAYEALLHHPDFIRTTSRATANVENLKLRLNLASDAFSGLT